MQADASDHAWRVCAVVAVERVRQPLPRRMIDRETPAGRVVDRAVRLEAVERPNFDLQPVGRENLRPHADEVRGQEVGRKRRLIVPVLEREIAGHADVRHEDAGVDVDAVQHVPVVAGVRFANVAKRRRQIVLPFADAGVVARRQRRHLPGLQVDRGAHILPVKIAARGDEHEIEFVMPRGVDRADDRVVLGAIEIEVVAHVEQHRSGEVLGVEQRLLLAVRPVHPGEIAERERVARGRRRIGFRRIGLRRGSGRGRRRCGRPLARRGPVRRSPCLQRPTNKSGQR